MSYMTSMTSYFPYIITIILFANVKYADKIAHTTVVLFYNDC